MHFLIEYLLIFSRLFLLCDSRSALAAEDSVRHQLISTSLTPLHILLLNPPPEEQRLDPRKLQRPWLVAFFEHVPDFIGARQACKVKLQLLVDGHKLLFLHTPCLLFRGGAVEAILPQPLIHLVDMVMLLGREFEPHSGVWRFAELLERLGRDGSVLVDIHLGHCHDYFIVCRLPHEVRHCLAQDVRDYLPLEWLEACECVTV